MVVQQIVTNEGLASGLYLRADLQWCQVSSGGQILVSDPRVSQQEPTRDPLKQELERSLTVI